MGNDQGLNLQGDIARATADFQAQFAKSALPSIKDAAKYILAELNPGGPPSSVATAFGQARTELERSFASDRAAGTAAIKQEALQSGIRYSPGAISEATDALQTSLDREQGSRLRALNFEEANTGMNETNRLIASLLKTGSQTAQGSLAFGQNASGAASILSAINRRDQQQNSGIGSIIGTIAGGIIGSFIPGGTAIGAGVGGAVGGFAGGFF